MPVYTLAQIAGRIGGKVSGNTELEIDGVSQIDMATKGKITFIANPKYKQALQSTGASAVIIDAKADITPSIPFIIVADAYFGFLQTFLLFNPTKKILEDGIHPSAVIHDSAKVSEGVAIGANAYIGAGVVIGSKTQIFPNCVILNNSKIGDGCTLYPSVTVREECSIGDRVIIHNGTVIGSDGFGFAFHEGKYHKIPQLGRVVIEDDVEIGANTTIDRATMGETVIKKGVKLDNLIQIAHNCVIGENTVIAAQTGISGSTTVGRTVVIAGQVGLVGHIKIGDGAQLGAQSGVTNNVPDGGIYFGYPARPAMRAKRIEAVVNNLPDLRKRIKSLEKEISELKSRLSDLGEKK